MKKTDSNNPIINQPISALISGLAHTDMLTIADAGLPIPASTQRIDLALIAGVPSFLQTLEAILTEIVVEKAYVSEDVLTVSPHIYEAMRARLGDTPIDQLPHTAFKQMTGETKAVIRTGEFTPYANIILVAGAWGFDV